MKNSQGNLLNMMDNNILKYFHEFYKSIFFLQCYFNKKMLNIGYCYSSILYV